MAKVESKLIMLALSGEQRKTGVQQSLKTGKSGKTGKQEK